MFFTGFSGQSSGSWEEGGREEGSESLDVSGNISFQYVWCIPMDVNIDVCTDIYVCLCVYSYLYWYLFMLTIIIWTTAESWSDLLQ